MADDVILYDWDDTIENDGEQSDFVTLEEGDYEFTVHKWERGHYTPTAGAKTPACNQVELTLQIRTKNGDAYVNDKIQLASTMEWKLAAFFRSIGLKKHGEKLKMEWDKINGRKGRAHITKTPGKNEGVFFNNVARYLDPVAKTEDDEWS